MVTLTISIIAIVISYLFGSIPMGYLIARLYGVDIRTSGSGKTGGTNVLRTAGVFAAGLTVLGDVLKGMIPIYLIATLGLPLTTALCATATVVGHNNSIFLGFRGGAGAGTAIGALAGMSFPLGLIAAICGLTALVLSRIASILTSTIAVSSFIILIISAILGYTPYQYIVAGFLNLLVIAYALRHNFAALRAGTERRIGQNTDNIAKASHHN